MQSPTSLQKAVIYFSDPDRAFNYFANARWPNGNPACPSCKSNRIGFIKTRKKWQCKEKECRKQFTVKTGTIMEDSPLGLDKWGVAIWLITNAKNGISSCELARDLEVTQKTAWFMLHRVRLAMSQESLEKLSGEVEADETYVGGKARFMHHDKKNNRNGTAGKTAVLGALERATEKGKSKVRAKVISKPDRKTLKKEIEATVEKGSILYTDQHSGYDALGADYVRLIINHAKKYVDGKISTNGIENFWTLLKRALKGTYVAVEPFHLFRYVDEEAYRFNYRSLTDGQRFEGVVSGITGKRIMYKQLIGEAK